MSRKLPIRSEPLTNLEKLWGNSARVKDTYLYPVVMLQRPQQANVTIYNVATTDATWTKIPATSTLSGILNWRLSERNGNDFRFAFVAAPTTYATGFGFIKEATAITAIYVQRPTSTNITMELVTWS